ncbi:MAG: HD domain-containing protein [Chloroflexota bacterium]
MNRLAGLSLHPCSEVPVSETDRVQQTDVKGAMAYARQRLQQELAPELAYHNLAHTFEHVLLTALELAAHYQVALHEKELLAVVAAFHDIGWTVQGQRHERVGAQLARQVLPDFGFLAEQVERVAGLVLAMQMPHRTNSLLDQILIDADMDLLGRDDFWQRNNHLRAENWL